MKYFLYFLLFVAVLISGCEPKEAQEPFRPKFAVRCILVANQIAAAEITYTSKLIDTIHYSNTDIIFISEGRWVIPKTIVKNAKVILLKNNCMVDSLHYNSKTYQYEGSNHKVESGGNYRIEIQVDDAPLCYATCTVPFPVKIIRIDTVTEKKTKLYSNDSDYQLCYNLTFADPVQESNLYELEFHKLYTKEYYRNYQFQYFYTFGSLEKDPVFENSMNTFSPAFFSDKLFNGKTLSLKLKPQQTGRGFNEKIDSLVWFNLANVSVEKYRLTKCFDLNSKNYLNAFMDPTPVYNNIINGVGIFAAKAVSSDTIRDYKP